MRVHPSAEKRLFQIVVLIATVVPIAAGGAGVLSGVRMIGTGLHPTPDLDSHFRYLSGLLLGIGLAFAWTVARLDERATTFRVLGLIVIVGGLARLAEALRFELPGRSHAFALIMELVVVPALLLWLRRIERVAGRENRAAVD